MPLLEALPLNASTAQWSVWSTTARLVVTDPASLKAARAIAERKLAAVDLACSRFRDDSELALLPAGRPVEVSPLLAALVRESLAAAESSNGLVNPTVGAALAALGYDRDWSAMGTSSVDVSGAGSGKAPAVRVRKAPSWRQVRIEGLELTVPAGVRLDLGATGKAFTADLIAAEIVEQLGVGVLVALGGDIATAGPLPGEGWNVLVQDEPGDPAITVLLPPDGAIATSSTQSRRWRASGRQLHHIVDPRSCRPAETVWRTATVAAATCVRANTLSTAALILGHDAPSWLREQGQAARLVSADGQVLSIAGFPTGVSEKGQR